MMMPIEDFEQYYNNVLDELLESGKIKGIKLKAYELTEEHHIKLHGVRRFCHRDSFRAGVTQFRNKQERKASNKKHVINKSNERRSRSKEFESKYNWIF